MRSTRSALGFSLIEIMIALAVVAFMAGTVIVNFGGLTQSERLGSAARKLSGMSDFVRSEATSARRTAYLDIDFDLDRFRFRLDPPSDALGRSIDPDHKKPMNEAELKDWMDNYEWEELPRGVHFRRLWISKDKYYDKKSVEVAYSANGTLASFILWLQSEKKGDQDGEWFSIVVNGLTGRSEVLEWAAEFTEASETDFNDVMQADQARRDAK